MVRILLSLFDFRRCTFKNIEHFCNIRQIVVKEKWIPLAMLRLLENEKCVLEGAGASGFAAVLSGQLEEFAGKK